jgi:hypothetical protein
MLENYDDDRNGDVQAGKAKNYREVEMHGRAEKGKQGEIAVVFMSSE